ncbi:MAG: DUF3592 domain-containing protein [Verrucomicrobiales bacterium]
MADRTVGGRIYLSLIGLMLAAIGLVFTWLMWRSFDRARQIETWPFVPCAILESTVEQRRIGPEMPLEFSYGVRYAYDWEGKEYESERVGLRKTSWSRRREKAEALVEKYPEGSVQECRVNPGDPEMSVLARESKAPGYSIWFPLIFVVGGFGVVVGAWGAPRVSKSSEDVSATAS